MPGDGTSMPGDGTSMPGDGTLIRTASRVMAVAVMLIAAYVGALAIQPVGVRPTTGAMAADPPRQKPRRRSLPALSRPDTYVSSRKCVECHQDQHASWHRSYHRTMSQVAVPANVMSDFREETVLSQGLKYRVFRRGDAFFAEMPDPDYMMLAVQGKRDIPLKSIKRIERRVVMATGSHHYQTYWVASPRFETVLQTLPLVYLPDEKQWIPREAAFMTPPGDGGRMITQWNHHCIQCHSTGGVPGLNMQTGMLNTSVGELGISCEACHGPGEEHVRKMESASDGKLNLPKPGGQADLAIVNPADLDHRRMSQICGQCHGVYIRVGELGMKFAREGILFRPGDDIHQLRYYMRYPKEDSPKKIRDDFRANREFFRERWWDDGTLLAGGREYTAIREVACHQQGEMSCLSCHSLHGYEETDDQLLPEMRTSQACTQCHGERQYTSDVTAHTHHAADSSGSNCLNCHMPHTSYGLFKGIRNHSISLPSVTASVEHGVPNACNLCHLDQTLRWTQQHLSAWFGQESVELTEEQQQTSAALLWLLKGHAAQRVITAWHFGWQPAQEASGTDWTAPFLARLISDPYGVIRYVTRRSLRSLSGFADLEYDFLAPPEELAEVAARVEKQWRTLTTEPPSRSEILLDKEGRLMVQRLEKILSQRDNRAVHIKE